jgi:hypothetical protein
LVGTSLQPHSNGILTVIVLCNVIYFEQCYTNFDIVVYDHIILPGVNKINLSGAMPAILIGHAAILQPPSRQPAIAIAIAEGFNTVKFSPEDKELPSAEASASVKGKTRRTVHETIQWITSSEGLKALEHSLKQAQAMTDEFREAQRVDSEHMSRPITLKPCRPKLIRLRRSRMTRKSVGR